MDKDVVLGWVIIAGVAIVSYKAGRKVGQAEGEIVGVASLLNSVGEVCSKKAEE